MKYHCRSCSREFDVHGWLESGSNYSPPIFYPSIAPTVPQTAWGQGYATTSRFTKIPICPFCMSQEIEEKKDV